MSSTASALVYSVCYLTVVSWLTVGLTGPVATISEQNGYSVADIVAKAVFGRADWAVVVSSCPGVFGFQLNNVLSGLKHLRTHEYVGRLLADAVDWTVKGVVTTVKNREQGDSWWAFSTTSSLEGDGFIVTGNMSPSSEQQLAVTRSIALVTAGSSTTALFFFRQEDSLEVGKNLCKRSAST